MAAQKVEQVKEQIKFETEVLKLVTLVAVATGGGSLTLLLGTHTTLLLALAGLGFLATVGLAVIAWRFYRHICDLVARM